MKILHLSPYYLPHLGGVEKHLFAINQVLGKKHAITVLTSEKMGVSPLSKIQVWSWVIKNYQFFLAFDIIHVHDVFWWILPIYLLIRKKIFLTCHGWEGIYPIPAKIKWQRRIYNKLSRGVIHVGNYIEKFYGDKPDEVIWGAPPLLIPPQAGNRRGGGGGEVVFLGRLNSDLSINKYLALIKKLKLPVIFLGDGEYRKACERYGQVLGFVSHPEKYLAQADLVLASSYLSIFEALAQGKLVAAFYDNPLKKNILESLPIAAYICISDNVDDMLDKIKHFDKKKLKIGQKLAQEFTWSKIAGVYERMWTNSS